MGLHDLRTRGLVQAANLASEGPVAVPAVLPHAADGHSIYASAGNCVYHLDLRQVLLLHASPTSCMAGRVHMQMQGRCQHSALCGHRQGSAAEAHAYNSDEINSLALSPSGRFLAAADDAGEVRVVDVRSGTLHKTLRGGHSNIASGVCSHAAQCCAATLVQQPSAGLQQAVSNIQLACSRLSACKGSGCLMGAAGG